MLKTRIIARLDIRGANLIKPIRLEGVRVIGSPMEYALRYNDDGIDEIILMDAVASLYGRNSLSSLVEAVSEGVFVPMTVGGGIKNIQDVNKLMRSGADKVAINTAAVANPSLITEVAKHCGSQAMVLQIDAKKQGGSWEAYTDGGRNHTGKNAIEWAKEAVERGAGEILLTSIDREGTRQGFDLELIQAVSDAVPVPVIASGGFGQASHFIEAVKNGADAVAIADCLHYKRVGLNEIREEAIRAGVAVRCAA